MKTLETSKATDAVGQLQIIASANRMFYLDHNKIYASGLLDTACSLCGGCGTCPNACSGATPPGCCLVACKYLPTADWDGKPYSFAAAGGSCGTWFSISYGQCGSGSTPSSNYVACSQRKPGNAYSVWGYAVDTNGIYACTGIDPHVGAPPPPPT
jgi:hypothetical protein